MKGLFFCRTLILLASLCMATLLQAQTEPAENVALEVEAEIEVIALTDNLYMLMGEGGNIAVSTGPDGVFIVDDDVAEMAPKLAAALAEISAQPVSTVFNTHWHADHTGGNSLLGEAGAMIVAHDNVHERMSSTQYSNLFDLETLPAAAVARPVLTFDNTITFYRNGLTIKVIHVESAHTDGDSIVFFEELNVVHTGDVFFNGMYPFIDIDSGGSVRGVLAAVDQLLTLIDDETRIIPGHGPLARKADLESYRSMLMLVAARVQALIDEGKTKPEALALRPTTNFDADWAWDLLPVDVWVGLIYDSLAADSLVEVN